jgi:hypothetical protein
MWQLIRLRLPERPQQSAVELKAQRASGSEDT